MKQKQDYLKITKAGLLSLLIIGTMLPQLAGAANSRIWSWLGVSDKTTEITNETVTKVDSDTGFKPMTLGNIALVQPTMPIAQRYPQYAPYCAYKPGVSYCLTTVTAYSSTPDQTDSSPFITANGKHVEDGIVACNFLAFGTKVRFPDMYGDKVFTVEDRMAKKNNHKIDIWFPSRGEAKEFGVQSLKVEILD
jgi:3D (Asp-Asp-Asp) domain-containing protein